jgi:hypothetical protein
MAYGAGSLWVDDPKAKALVRLSPTDPAPALQPAEQVGTEVENGPLKGGVRVHVVSKRPHFSIVPPDDEWVAEGIAAGSVQIEAMRHDGTGVDFETLTQAFDLSGRVVPVRSPQAFLRILRRNPELGVSGVTPVALGNARGLRVRVESRPKAPYPSFCPGPCVVVFPIQHGTFILSGGIDEFTFVKRGKVLFFVDASFGPRVDPALERRIRRLVSSIRFDE